MREGIHPQYGPARIVCACGNIIETRSIKPEIHIEICSRCHPFFTGKQKFVDTAGRVERFRQRYEKTKAKAEARAKAKTEVETEVEAETEPQT